MVDHFNKRLREMREQLGGATAALREVGQERTVGLFDSLIHTSGDDGIKTLLGSGASDELSDDSVELERRNAVFDAWQSLREAKFKSGARVTKKVDRELFDAAARSTLAKDMERIRKDRVANAVRRRTTYTAGRPSGVQREERGTPARTYQEARRRAEAAIAKYL